MQTNIFHYVCMHNYGGDCINCASHLLSRVPGRHIYEIEFNDALRSAYLPFCDECHQKITARSASGHDDSCSEGNVSCNDTDSDCDDNCGCDLRIRYVSERSWIPCTNSYCRFCVLGIHY